MKIQPKICNIYGIIFSLTSLIILLSLYLSRPISKSIEQQIETVKSLPKNIEKQEQLKQDYSVIASKYLFHPLRGVKSEVKTEQKPKQRSTKSLKFELKGVYRSDNIYGALIQYKGIRRPSNKNSSIELKRADFSLYYVNSEIAEGYVLKKVNSDSVIITRNSEIIEVNLPKLMPPSNNIDKN
ncbi:type II secretion system protein N [Lentisphaerota bacterium WC36G]|nr:hypothetical protein LJT99_02005 [Lentisphaerae bacterium WC36]